MPTGTIEFVDGQTQATVAIDVSGDLSVESDEAFTVTLSNASAGEITGASETGTILNDDLAITLISDIQGNAATWGEQFGRTDATPFFGASVRVEAIVVGDFQDGDAGVNGDYNGFFLQEEDGDAYDDASTSEGIFVFQPSTLLSDVAIGDKVEVIGTATEFFGETQIQATSITVLESGVTLPTAATVSFPVANAIVNPDGQRIADLEAYEGMLVNVDQTMTVGDLFTLGRFGEIGLSANGRVATYTQENTPVVAGFAAYVDEQVRATVILDDGLSVQQPQPLIYPDGSFDALDGLRSGDTVESITGVVRYSRNSGSSGDENYRINPTEPVEFISTNPRDDTPPDVGGRLKVATFNVLNFFTTLDEGSNTSGPSGQNPRGADNQDEFDRQAAKLVSALAEIDADVLGLVELENEYGDQNGDGEFAIAKLVELLNAAVPGANYAFADPGTAFGGDDAIMVGIIYDQSTVRLERGSTVEILTDADLSGLGVDPGNPVFNGSGTSRSPIAASFEELSTGEVFTVAVNHFKSKGSPSPFGNNANIGDGTGSSNEARLQAAQALEAWLATNPTGTRPDPDTLILGDLNAYKMEDPVQELLDGVDGVSGTADDLVNLDEDYSFGFPLDFDNASQVQAFGSLDYALASTSLASQVTGAATWHINADEPAFIDYNTEFKPNDPALFSPDPFRSSDHDPIIVGLNLGGAEPETVAARLDFKERLFFDRVMYSVDGERVDAERLRFFQKEIDVEAAGITVRSDDGVFGPSLITTQGKGIGVRSFFGDPPFFGSERKTLDEAETLIFDLAEDFVFGDAVAAQFEFFEVSGAGQLELTFFDDTTLVDTAFQTISDTAVSYELASGQSFDRVELGTTGSLALTVKAVEFERILEEDPLMMV